jgi:hypothetical protein
VTTRGLLLLALLAVVRTSARAEEPPYRRVDLEVPRERVALVYARFDGDSRADLLIARDSSFELRSQKANGRFERIAGLDVTATLGGALFDIADLDGDGQDELYLLHRGGVDAYRFTQGKSELVRSGALIEGQRGIAHPQLSRYDFLGDFDGDGALELLFPADGTLYVFRRGAGKDPKAGFALVDQQPTPRAQVSVQLARQDLADRNSAQIRIPRPPQTGDGRGKAVLRIGKQFAVSAADGTGLGPGGEVSVRAEDDPLEPFRKRHGITLKGSDTFQSLLRDLDGDQRDDYTVIHGNRIWVYKGQGERFDFDRAPDQLLKVSGADRMLALLLPVNDDPRPDLVLFKYEQPSVARVVAALAIGLRAEIEVLAYENDGKAFARKPSLRSTLVINVPPLLQVASRFEQIVGDFRDAFRPLRSLASGDFDGDGTEDVLRLAASQLELYRSEPGRPPIDLESARASDFLGAYEGQGLVRKVLFDAPRKSLGLESSLELIRDVVSQVQVSVLAGREPTVRIPVDPEIVRRVDQLLSQDLDGDGRDDVLIYLEPPPYKGPPAQRPPAIPRRDQLQAVQLWLSAGTRVPAAQDDATPGASAARP